MTMNVIIGAGPAGLYTAIKLKKAGINNLVVYDPRAGSYTRPGHLNWNVFTKAEKGLDIQFWDDSLGHIKDLERSLYNIAIKLGIRIERKRFKDLHPDVKNPALIVADDMGNEELIHSNYVFDCTGSTRQVINAINQLSPDNPLKTIAFAELHIKNHFLAYVKMDSEQLNNFNQSKATYEHAFPYNKSAPEYAKNLLKLRAMGWEQLVYPYAYCIDFGKNKACIYMETPANLKEENYDSWVSTVVNCHQPGTVYEQLPPSKKHLYKPRFTPFTIAADELQQTSYKRDDLPTVIALGDAQISPFYELAHGILNGMERIDQLIEHMEIFDNDIYYFDSEEYQALIKPHLNKHHSQVINFTNKITPVHKESLEQAQLKLMQARVLSSDLTEKEGIHAILKEIEARQSYDLAVSLFERSHDNNNQLTPNNHAINEVILSLEQLHNHLLKAIEALPISFIKEREKAQLMINSLALSWKVIGNEAFKVQLLIDSLNCYKKALAIYNLPIFQGKHFLEELPIYSNLVIVYSNSQQYSEAIAAANIGLEIYEACPEEVRPTYLFEKIIFNLIKVFCAQAAKLLDNKKIEDAEYLHLRANDLFSNHQSKLSSPTSIRIKTTMEQLQRYLAVNLSQREPSAERFEADDAEINKESIIALHKLGTFSVQQLRNKVMQEKNEQKARESKICSSSI